MAEAAEYEVDRKVMVELVKKTLSDVEGVQGIKRGLWGDDLRVRSSKEGVRLRLGIVVKEGVTVPTVAQTATEQLRHNIQTTLGLPIADLKLTVRGIKFHRSSER
jgi:uncharacterized alkaline shock family protein YloU